MPYDISKALLVGLYPDKDESSLIELERLVETAGWETVGQVVQHRLTPDKATYVGKGKLAEIKSAAEALGADAVIFDNDLSGVQFRNIERVVEMDVLDRKTLILEIFSLHATSNEGKLQVELAQKRNLLPRMIGRIAGLSRQGGGGSGGGGARRGGGEQQLEIDRRVLKKDIEDLEEKIDKLGAERNLRREKRIKNKLKVVSIVGYTNAGKSTLMNSLTKAGVKAEDKLFATLDPVGRKLRLGEGKDVLVVDTVGFISRLPHELISAFRSTLEEVKYSDLIIHVADGASDELMKQYAVVNDVLESIGAGQVPKLVALNKSDLGEIKIYPQCDNIVVISAETGEGLENLKEKIAEAIYK
jgi:GTP-binding protein HflX